MVKLVSTATTGEFYMIIREGCPQCGSTQFKKNGYLPSGKQSHRCRGCGRQFVLQFEQRLVSDQERALIRRLLCERLSLHGICRAVGVTMRWLMGFIGECYALAPDDLNVQLPGRPVGIVLRCLGVEADELQSFVGNKANKQWLWLAMDTQSRQAIAFHIGDRSKISARKLWEQLPVVYRQRALFWTDAYQAYQGVIPPAQHRAINKKARQTNRIERLNCTLRQRLSRLVRSALSFSKKLDNHIGAIRYFLSYYNLELARA